MGVGGGRVGHRREEATWGAWKRAQELSKQVEMGLATSLFSGSFTHVQSYGSLTPPPRLLSDGELDTGPA